MAGLTGAPARRSPRANPYHLLTYPKGRAAQRRFPAHRFARRWWAFEGQRRVYRCYEKGTRATGAGVLRTVLWQAPDKSQIPVLTNRADWLVPKLVHAFRCRWRQESSLKDLVEEYAIDQLIQYGADAEPDRRLVPNSARRALRERLARLRQDRRHLVATIRLAAYDAERWLNTDVCLHVAPAANQTTPSAGEVFTEV